MSLQYARKQLLKTLFSKRPYSSDASLKRAAVTVSNSEYAKAASLSESYLSGSNLAVLEDYYGKWQMDRTSIPDSWSRYFDHLERNESAVFPVHAFRKQPSVAAPSAALTEKNLNVLRLIRSYRVFGHLSADLDPLGLWHRPSYPELDYKYYGFTEADLDIPFYVGTELAGSQNGYVTLRHVIDTLKRVYSGKVGVEYMHIQNPEMKDWLMHCVENQLQLPVAPEKQRVILEWLQRANDFEQFLATTYKTAKRFGLEGCESLIPGLEAILLHGSHLGIDSVALGMPHRGRLNVLSNVLQKPLTQLFCEFADRHPDKVLGSGDVKYHLGTASRRTLLNGKSLSLTLAANPSHLEAVDPVVIGKTRAKQYYSQDTQRNRTMAILLHGDAAFAGQGVVAETLELADLHHYTTGGTIHIIVNNQIGFTTVPKFARSSPYPTDVAKGLQVPIFHVNGDDPDMVVKACEAAVAWRQRFHKDVVIDLFSYRRHGHNEMDQPSFTQPIMYDTIRDHPTTSALYAQQLIRDGVVQPEAVQALTQQYVAHCKAALEESKVVQLQPKDWDEAAWNGMVREDVMADKKRTGVDTATLRQLSELIHTLPDEQGGFVFHKNIRKLYDQRRESVARGDGIDWATGEALAMATLLDEGFVVRLSGQDCERGTFSQRHAVLYDQRTERTYTPLDRVMAAKQQQPQQQQFQVINSSLSEFAVMGFEHGFSLEHPRSLVMWEGQFGDFANGAQVMIDQFVAASEAKWGTQSGLTLLLPHGFEGQGPEHSSARLERYLQLVNESQFYGAWKSKVGSSHEQEMQARMQQMQECNMQVVHPSTPANFFHFLRRQMHREFRKPLVVMTPKSLLKASYCASPLSEFAQDYFTAVYGDVNPSRVAADRVQRIVFCSGKVYYDLVRARELNQVNDVAIVRMEQLAPFPYFCVRRELDRYARADIVFCQEEPENMGAWSYVAPRLQNALASERKISYVGRAASASPATGSPAVHQRELESFVRQALDVRGHASWKPLFGA